MKATVKSTLIIIAALMLALSLAACGSSATSETTTSASSKAKETTTEAATEEQTTQEQTTQQAQDTASKITKVYAMAGDMDEASTLSAWEIARGGLAETSVAGLYTMTAEDGTSVYVSFDGETVSEISEEEAGVQTQRAEEQAARQAASQAASASSGSSSNKASASTSSTTSGSTASNKTSSGSASNKTSGGSDTSGNETTANTASNKTSGTGNNSQSTQSNASSQSSSSNTQATTQPQTEAATQAQTQTTTQPETQTTTQPQTEAATQAETQTETTHAHNWVAVYKTEQYVVKEAYDEYVSDMGLQCNGSYDRNGNICDYTLWTSDYNSYKINDDIAWHCATNHLATYTDPYGNTYTQGTMGWHSVYRTLTIHHDAEYGTRQVVDYYECSCGETKAAN